MDKERLQVKPGYYGMVVDTAHDSIESISKDETVRCNLRNMLAASESRIAFFSADERNESFYVVQALPKGGIVSAIACHATRADSPGEAYAAIANGAAAYPDRPLMVSWLETVDRVMH